MAMVTANGIQLAYEVHGDRACPVILMVQGLGCPLNAWPAAMIEQLVEAGYCVISFDNRDVGLSQQITDVEMPDITTVLVSSHLGNPVKTPYKLNDMMRDMLALMDALDIEKADVVGISMGGMISQLLAIEAPQRVNSLTCIMSTSGKRGLPGPTAEVLQHLATKPLSDEFHHRLEFQMKTLKLIGSPRYSTSDESVKAFVTSILDRGVHKDGTLRQMMAMVTAPSRVEPLKILTVPTTVIHGADDPLIPLQCGENIASVVPNAQLEIFPGMGHEIPEELVANFVTLIIENTKKSSAV